MNQHYVPRVYLKKFAEKKGKEYFVDVYDKEQNRFFKANTRKICSEIDLYTLEVGNGLNDDLLAVEKLYSNNIEPLFENAYKVLTDHNVFSISDLQRIEILLSVFQFYLRNPKLLKRILLSHKVEIDNLFKNAIENGHKGLTYLGEDFSFREYDLCKLQNYFEQKITKDYKEKHIGGLTEIGTFHEFAKFEVNIIRDNSVFFTSDSPLVFRDVIVDDENPMRRSKEFILTLNKKTVLRIFHDNRLGLNRIYRRYILDGDVTMLNDSILEQSSRFVIVNESEMSNHTRLFNVLNDHSACDKMIDFFKQIVAAGTKGDSKDDGLEIMKYYIGKFDEKGFLSDEEQHEMAIKMKNSSVEFAKRRIQDF